MWNQVDKPGLDEESWRSGLCRKEDITFMLAKSSSKQWRRASFSPPARSKGLQTRLWVWLTCSGPQAGHILSPLYLMQGKIFSSLGKYISLCWAALVPGIISAHSKKSCAEKDKSLCHVFGLGSDKLPTARTSKNPFEYVPSRNGSRGTIRSADFLKGSSERRNTILKLAALDNVTSYPASCDEIGWIWLLV